MKEWHFFDKVYRRWVVLVIGTREEFKEFMDLTGYKYTDDLDLNVAKGACMRLTPEENTSGNNCNIVWLEKYETTTLIHELSHLVMHVFDSVGVPIGNDNTEGFAFYLEYWFTEIQRVKRKYPNGRTPAEARKAA